MLAFSCPLVFAQQDHLPLKKNMEYVKWLVPIMPGWRSPVYLLIRRSSWRMVTLLRTRTDKSPFFAVMREYNVVLGFFLVSSIFLKVCSTWTMYVPVETINSQYSLLYTNHFFVFAQTGVLSLISMGTAQNVHEYIESFISTTRKGVPISSRRCNI